MAAFDFKTATPATASASALIFGAETQASATPSIYTTTGSGNVVLDTAPTLVTPVLGVATATSVNKLTITAPATSATLTIANGKTFTASNTLTLAGTDGSTLNVGTGGTLGALATVTAGTGVATAAANAVNGTGGFITFATYAPASGKTLTLSNTLTLAGTDSSTLNIGSGGTLNSVAVAGSTLSWSSPALTIGTQQTTQGSLVLANTAAGAYATTIKSSNSASAAWTLTLPPTAGTNLYVLQTDGSGNTSWVAQSGGAGGITIDTTAITSGTAGRLLFESSTNKVTESSLLSFDSTNGALSVGGATVTTSNPVLNLSQTWNAGAVTFTGIKFNVKDTTSASGSLFFDFQVDGVSKASIRKDGAGFFGGTNGIFGINNGGNYSLITYLTTHSHASDAWIGWDNVTSATGAVDTFMRRDAAGVMGLRGSSATTPAAMSFYTYGASPPAAPAASIVRIYADTSGGKIRLMAIFPSGAAQQIATEP